MFYLRYLLHIILMDLHTASTVFIGCKFLFDEWVCQVHNFLFDRPFPNGGNIWKGVLNNGKSGFFNPAYTVAYLGSNLPSNKSEFIRGGMYKQKKQSLSISWVCASKHTSIEWMILKHYSKPHVTLSSREVCMLS